MQHWILQCNPSKWRIFDFRADGEELTSWIISQHVDDVRVGDDISLWLTGSRGGVAAVGEVTGLPKLVSNEGTDPYHVGSPHPGAKIWVLPIRMNRWFLDDPVGRDALRTDHAFARSTIIVRPWASNPFPVTDAEWKAILHHTAGRGLRGGHLPAEALTGATDLLRRLIGRPLKTVTGRSNIVLGVTPPTALVATERSPAGQPVPIVQVDEALNRLARDGSVEIHPRTSAYRSAFVGAVLLTLPGARHSGSPPVITLGEPDTNESSDGYSFDGDLTSITTTAQRREQTNLRRRLFGNLLEAPCALCGETYPVRLLWAAHIKKRAACTDGEARDLDHIAMVACVLGCDALYETGYIAVDSAGRIVTTTQPGMSLALSRRLDRLRGRRVTVHQAATSGYFAWHHANTFHP